MLSTHSRTIIEESRVARNGASSQSTGYFDDVHYESPLEDNPSPLFSSNLGSDTHPPSTSTRAPSRIYGSRHHSSATPGARPQAYVRRTTTFTNSLNNVLPLCHPVSPSQKLSISDRIACHRWTYFTMTMSTGGMANVLYSLPWDEPWLRGIGLFFYFLNLCLFVTNCVLITTRFYLRPGSFTTSFSDQSESLFIPSFVVSIAVILITTCQYGIPHTGHWLLHTMEILFWIYMVFSVLSSAFLYTVLWSTLVFPLHTMTPTWIFPAYPLLLNAPFAANLIAAAIASDNLAMINPTAMAVGAAAIQGTGTLIAVMISSAFIYRLMTQKLPRDNQRPGIFMSIGPYGFTAAGIGQLGNQAESILHPNFMDVPNAPSIVKVVCILVSLWVWGLAMWFFVVCVGALWKYVRTKSRMPFQMTWWSFVFPNTALIVATSVMGTAFNARGLHICAAVLTAILIFVWLGIFVKMLWNIKKKDLLWPVNPVSS